jgi:hypothetical protein
MVHDVKIHLEEREYEVLKRLAIKFKELGAASVILKVITPLINQMIFSGAQEELIDGYNIHIKCGGYLSVICDPEAKVPNQEPDAGSSLPGPSVDLLKWMDEEGGHIE